MSQRFFLQLAYRGSSYHGWQRQHNAHSVQEALEAALQQVLRSPTALIGCGRTDTGVHASRYYAHFDAAEALPANFLPHLNSLVRPDIVAHALHPVHANAHARFDAVLRVYVYYLHHFEDPFLRGLSTSNPFDRLDMERMNEAAECLPALSDFTSFMKTGSSAKTARCRVQYARWEPLSQPFPEGGSGEMWLFRIAADRFLRGMVRLIVGALMEVGRGRLSPEEFRQTVASGQRFRYATSAPPDGLYLSQVHYPYLNPPP